MFQKIYFRNVIAIVLVLPNVFIVSYRIAKCIREITRGGVMCCYLTTIELIYDQMFINLKTLFLWESVTYIDYISRVTFFKKKNKINSST